MVAPLYAIIRLEGRLSRMELATKLSEYGDTTLLTHAHEGLQWFTDVCWDIEDTKDAVDSSGAPQSSVSDPESSVSDPESSVSDRESSMSEDSDVDYDESEDEEYDPANEVRWHGRSDRKIVTREMFDKALEVYRGTSRKRNNLGENVRSLSSMQHLFGWIRSESVLRRIVKYGRTGIFPGEKNVQLRLLAEDLNKEVDALRDKGRELRDINIKTLALTLNRKNKRWKKFKADKHWIRHWKKKYAERKRPVIAKKDVLKKSEKKPSVESQPESLEENARDSSTRSVSLVCIGDEGCCEPESGDEGPSGDQVKIEAELEDFVAMHKMLAVADSRDVKEEDGGVTGSINDLDPGERKKGLRSSTRLKVMRVRELERDVNLLSNPSKNIPKVKQKRSKEVEEVSPPCKKKKKKIKKRRPKEVEEVEETSLCEICNLPIRNSLLYYHASDHVEVHSYFCPAFDCSFSCRSSGDAQNHMREVHNDRRTRVSNVITYSAPHQRLFLRECDAMMRRAFPGSANDRQQEEEGNGGREETRQAADGIIVKQEAAEGTEEAQVAVDCEGTTVKEEPSSV